MVHLIIGIAFGKRCLVCSTYLTMSSGAVCYNKDFAWTMLYFVYHPMNKKGPSGSKPAQAHIYCWSQLGLTACMQLGVQCFLGGLREGFWPSVVKSFLLLLWGYCSPPGPLSINNIYTNPVVSCYLKRDSSFLLLIHSLCSKIMCRYRYSFQLQFCLLNL